MKRHPHGITVIICNKNFISSKLSTLEAAGNDWEKRFLGLQGWDISVLYCQRDTPDIESIVTVRSAEFANHDSFVCCIMDWAVGKKIFISESLTVDLLLQNWWIVKLYRESQSCSSFTPVEEVGGMEVLWSLLESNRSYRRLESLRELTSVLALQLHLTLLHLQKNTGIIGVLPNLLWKCKVHACIWWICTPWLMKGLQLKSMTQMKASTKRCLKFNTLFTKMFTIFLEQL